MTETENLFKSDGPENLSLGLSISIENWEIEKTKIENSDVYYTGQKNLRETVLDEKLDQPIMFAPRPTIELDAAAIKLQKVYKSYRTRRNLADCAVVIEELWWQALDFAALKRSSFFDVKKHESASSRWGRAMTRAAKVGKGLSKDENAQKLALQHWLEAIDPRHRYGHNLHFYYDVWFDSKSTQPFFYWLDVGDGKEVNIINSPRVELHCQCIEYLGPSERKAYEVIVDSGKLVYSQNGMLVNTIDDSKWIFVLSTSRALYVGKKRKGMFQHSSFLSGGAITAAGRLVAHDGVLEAIWPYSGHYLPTEDNFKEFLIFLEENHIDLSNVKRCSMGECESPTSTSALNNFFVNDDEYVVSSCQEEAIEAEVFDTVKPLSCKWTSGVGPRIGCVREYPTQLQIKALEHLKLSPKITVDAIVKYVPIPVPRPIPKIRVSPRLAYMGLPTPVVPITYVI